MHQAQRIANVVPVPKKDGKVRMCVNFRDLNKAYPKDDFPLPHIDILVDNMAGNALMSFMDGFSRYNQIKMASKDVTKTTFTTEWGKLLLHSNAIWAQECQSNKSKNGHNFATRHDAQ